MSFNSERVSSGFPCMHTQQDEGETADTVDDLGVSDRGTKSDGPFQYFPSPSQSPCRSVPPKMPLQLSAAREPGRETNSNRRVSVSVSMSTQY